MFMCRWVFFRHRHLSMITSQKVSPTSITFKQQWKWNLPAWVSSLIWTKSQKIETVGQAEEKIHASAISMPGRQK